MRINQKQAKRTGDKLKVNWDNISLKQFTMGMNAELEHRNVTRGNLILTGKIALAHLKEFPDYYTRLKRMEKRG